jgi:uncharacterized membrane-anchored protein
MTIVDLIAVLLLCIIGLGGYSQGFVRGILRLLALVAGGLLGLGLVLNFNGPDTAGAAGSRAAVAAFVALGAASAAAWVTARAIPSFVHRHLANRVLGILPAFVIGLVLLTLGLGLADRLAVSPATQELLRRGAITAPLVSVTDLLEQMLAGVR